MYRALFLGALLGVFPTSCDANDDSIVRTADCSMCSEDLVTACQDQYTECIAGSETSNVCQGRIEALCATDAGDGADAGDAGADAGAGDGADAGDAGAADAGADAGDGATPDAAAD